MKFFKKFAPWLLCLLLAVAMVIMAIVGMQSVNSYKQTLQQQEASIADMSSFIDNDIGPLIDCYVVNTSVRVGDTVTEEMLTPISIPESIAYADKEVEVETVNEDGDKVMTTENQKVLNVVTSTNDAVGLKFRVALDANSILSPDDLIDNPLDNTTRMYEATFDDFPTDIQVGDYVDIRIRFTYGEDFISIPHKRIEGMILENGIFQFYFTEHEINVYDSMLLDKAMYDSVTIYLLKYVDPSSQTAAEGFYPINNNIAEIMNANPGLLDLVEEKMMLERKELSSMMGGDTDSFDDKRLNEVSSQIRDIIRDYAGEKSSAIKDRVKEEAAAARAAAKANS